jgi:chloride channel protein, CIC family
MQFFKQIGQNILNYRIRHKENRNFFFLVSIFVGLVGGFIALTLKTFVFYLRGYFLSPEMSNKRFLLLILPAIGIFLTVVMKKWLIRDNIRHNIASILHAISKRNSLMRLHKVFSSVLGAVFTAGLGGSVGLESPVISSGAAFGSNLGRWLRMNYKEMTVLLACGSAAGISAIFNTPIAGIIFAIEILMIDLTRFSLIPLLLSSMTGTLVTFTLYGEGVLFEYSIKEAFKPEDIPYFILFSIIAAIVSLYFSSIFLWIENQIRKIKSVAYRLLLGGTLLGVLLYFFPQLYGEGYQAITLLLNGDLTAFVGDSIFQTYVLSSVYLFVALLFVLVFLKVIATAITISAGGIGGIFAPSTFTGAMTGYLFAFSVNMIAGEQIISPGNFALVGMAACLSGVLHAPLTGLFLIAEITQGYHLIVPLMIAVTIVFIIVKAIQPNSIFTKQLAQRGELITHHKDKAVLTFLNVNHLIERDLTPVPIEANLGELVKYISQSSRNLFPVMGKDNKLEGLIHMEDVREIMFHQELYENTFVRTLMRIPGEVIKTTDTMQEVMDKFHRSYAWNLPVVNDDFRYIGVISKSNLFTAYRKKLISITED